MPLTIGYETEQLEKYYPGGFCPVDIGDRIAGRFTILHKLGYGGFGIAWLARDKEKRHGRYAALKIVAADSSGEYESQAVIDRLRKYEQDHGSPGLFLLELERVFHTSKNGRHLCQVFPVLGPSLKDLITPSSLLYPSFVKPFARQVAVALDAMHSMGVCHGDLTLKNIAVRLDRSLETLAEDELVKIFGEPRTENLDGWYTGGPSPLPNFAFEVARLILLPPDYLSTKLCILDFDQAFLSDHPPRDLAHIPVPFLAPESIFTLTNGPAADVWAFGSILFNLRKPTRLFSNFASCDPESTVLMMHRVLGGLPKEWLTFPFLDGYPVHEPLQPDMEYDTFEHVGELAPAPWVHTLEQHINQILEPRRPVTKTNLSVGVEKFCLQVPDFDGRDREGLKKFMADNATHIRKEDAALFTNLLRRIFAYDHRSRITAKQILEHPWFRGPGQTLPLAQPKQVAQKFGQGTNQHKTLNRIVPVQHPATTTEQVRSKAMSATKKAPPLGKGPELKTDAAVLPQKDGAVHDPKKDEERRRKAKKPKKR